MASSRLGLTALILAGLAATGWLFTGKPPLPPSPLPESGAAPAPPPAVRLLGGSPVGEPAAEPPRYTNEDLQRDLEKQKKALGIRKIIPPSSEDETEAEGADIAQRSDMALSRLAQIMRLRSAPQVSIQGGTPRIAAVMPPYPGTVSSTDEEAAAAWAEASLEMPRPRVNYSKHSLVIAPGPISAVKETAGYVVIQYRKEGPAAARYAVMPKTSLPIVFEPVP